MKLFFKEKRFQDFVNVLITLGDNGIVISFSNCTMTTN